MPSAPLLGVSPARSCPNRTAGAQCSRTGARRRPYAMRAAIFGRLEALAIKGRPWGLKPTQRAA